MRVSTQTPLHAESPAGHAHWPNVHALPGAQDFPHAPQFRGSTARSAHAPAQLVSVGAHAAAHAPFEQTWAVPHTVVHVPQRAGSLVRSTQTEPQSVAPAGQRHVPFAQTWPGPQVTPHPPQFSGSSFTSTQPPAHAFRAPLQEARHAPSSQTVGPVQ